MERSFSWSPNVSAFGGIEAFSRRVLEARDEDPKAELLLVRVSQGIALKVSFQRQGLFAGTNSGEAKTVSLNLSRPAR